MTNALSLRPGDRVPDFALPGLDGKHRKFIWSFTGEPVALVAVDDLANLDAGQFTSLIDACTSAAVVPVVVAGNALAGALSSKAPRAGDVAASESGRMSTVAPGSRMPAIVSFIPAGKVTSWSVSEVSGFAGSWPGKGSRIQWSPEASRACSI